MLAVNCARPAPQVAVGFRPAEIGGEPANLAGLEFQEGTLKIVIANRVGNRPAQLFRRVDRIVGNDWSERRIAWQGHIASAGRRDDRTKIFIVDIAKDRTAAKGIRSPHGHAIEDKADLLQIEGANGN